ncbi:uncharacterized protein LOC120295649 [Eucalyptus grandis]|uniref:uncharacterized protein LOC120295649 n=1 Tax=Eucalyptus grandis TaxID=71139 RepID=UPI00192F0726|nr:uncharacterized protein LOC120295649 [Eucalyptus grandis]
MERSAWPKNLSSSRKHAIQDLLHAQNPMKKFTDLFDAHSQTGNNTGQPLFAEHLVVNFLGPFSNSRSLSSSAESDEVLQAPPRPAPVSDLRSPREVRASTPRSLERLQIHGRLDQNLIDNGQQWRKYHLKSIINFDSPGYLTNDISISDMSTTSADESTQSDV